MKTVRESVTKEAAEHRFFDLCAYDPGFLGRGLARAAAKLAAKRGNWRRIQREQIAKAR